MPKGADARCPGLIGRVRLLRVGCGLERTGRYRATPRSTGSASGQWRSATQPRVLPAAKTGILWEGPCEGPRRPYERP
jgi:hypothetical protein